MKTAKTQHHQRRLTKLIVAFFCLLLLSAVSLAWRFHERRPRVWRSEEVPVVFWSWRNENPSQADVERAVSEVHAQALFLRAGQIDFESGTLRRVRAVEGTFPHSIEIHLVYNATRSLLVEFERVDINALAAVLSEAYSRDSARAALDGAQVAGIQLDIDVPTRLLVRYEQLLKGLRARLPQGTKLSVTGLSTWMDNSYLATMLRAVDFWMPQCYGAVIPEKANRIEPISSPQAVADTIARARKLNVPFYAGLAAYNYAILYSAHGNLIEVRGDLDPQFVVNDPNFELVERRPFRGVASNETPNESEWRYVYRARSEGVIDGLVVHEGDTLMLDLPTAETLRASLRAVREQAGDKLLGVCIFRLPVKDDKTVLTLEQISTALADSTAVVQANIQIRSARSAQSETSPSAFGIRLRAFNAGVAGGQFGDDAITVSLRVLPGSVRGVTEMEGFFSLETLCEAQDSITVNNNGAIRPCSLHRANLLRLRMRTWNPGASAQASISFEGKPPQSMQTIVTLLADDGRLWKQEQTITVQQKAE